MWLGSGCLRRLKHEISPNHLPWKLALAVSCARQWAFKWLLDSETCRMIYFWRSAIAAVEPEVKLGRQRGGQRPFSPQGGPMTAHQFRLQPDPTLCGLSSFHKQTVGSVTRRRREPPSATVKLPLNGPTNGCSTGTDGRNTGLVAKADVEAMSAQKAYAAPHSVI